MSSYTSLHPALLETTLSTLVELTPKGVLAAEAQCSLCLLIMSSLLFSPLPMHFFACLLRLMQAHPAVRPVTLGFSSKLTRLVFPPLPCRSLELKRHSSGQDVRNKKVTACVSAYADLGQDHSFCSMEHITMQLRCSSGMDGGIGVVGPAPAPRKR